MNNTVINAGSHRYLSELTEFKDGLPHGVINKTKTDVGGTYVAANCSSNYIIVCPFRVLVDSIVADKNNRYRVFKCYGGTKESDFRAYIQSNQIYKVAVTYDSLPKLIRWIGNLDGWKLLVDEYHLILEDMDFRSNAIDGLINEVQKFKHYSFLSATPIEVTFEIDFIKELPHYTVIWDNLIKINPFRYKTTHLNKALAKFISIFLDEGFNMPTVDGDIKPVEELYIFINSVTSIRQILDTLELEPELVKVCCADRIRNNMIMDKYQIEPVSSTNKKINFFTKKCFQGCNLFSNNGLIIVASDAYKTQTLIDISTTMEQIAGRLRYNDEYQNVFRHILIHLYSTSSNILSDEEFDAVLSEKVINANALIRGWNSMDNEARGVWYKASSNNLESELVSVVDGNMVFNELKKKSFIYKQQLRKVYSNGVNVIRAYDSNSRYDRTYLEVDNLNESRMKLAKAITISYEQLLKDYITNPSSTYELEYPEFKEIVKYLKESEMNSCRWNKEKLLKLVDDKKELDKVFLAIHREGFIARSELTSLFKKEFAERGITLNPKATQIENCNLYSVEPVSKRIDGKVTKGYILGSINIFKI